MPRRRPTSPRHQRGAVIIWMAFFLLVMLMFIALGVDMAKLMAARTQLQNAADAAALAGASAFGDASGPEVTSLAKTRARETASYNTAFEKGATPVLVDTVSDVIVDRDSMTVRVIARRENASGTPVIAQFLQVIGMPHLDMRAAATARARGGCDLVPIAAQDPRAGPFVVGCTEYQIKYGSGNSFQGTYGALDFPACDQDPCGNGGANRYRCQLMNGYPCCQDSGTCIPKKSGNMSGPTEAALVARFSGDTDTRLGICYTAYTGNGSRIVSVPITGLLQGSGSSACYPVLHYGQFFLTRLPGSGGQSIIWANYMGPQGGNGPTRQDFHVWLVR